MIHDTARAVTALRTALGPSVGVFAGRPETEETCPCVLVEPPVRVPALEADGEALLSHEVQPLRVIARSYRQAALLAEQAADVLAGLGYRLTEEAFDAPPRSAVLRFEAYFGNDGLIYGADI